MDPAMANKELSSELTGLNKGEKELRKKYILIGISVAALSIFMFIIVLITVNLILKGRKWFKWFFRKNYSWRNKLCL